MHTRGLAIPAALTVLETRGFDDYRLLDSGSGRKLERFGSIVVDRPEPQALWRPRLEPSRWQSAHAVFAAADDEETGRWRLNHAVPESWRLDVSGVAMQARLANFRHLGVFPEQVPHWEWMLSELKRFRAESRIDPPRVLNLFAYTGAASLLAARDGAEVVHLDASKKAIAWARENQAASNLTQARIRWIVEDARKFVAREVRRGRTYNLIVVDPPKFGRGPEGEVWDLFTDLPALITDCVRLLDPKAAALVLTVYAIRASALAFGQLTAERLSPRPGSLDVGELAIREEEGHRLLPTSLFARWSSHGP